MRVAVFSDIHGNTIALDTVLADITARGGADAYWVLGDLVSIGAEPVQTPERLATLPNATFVQGNGTRVLLTHVAPGLNDGSVSNPCARTIPAAISSSAASPASARHGGTRPTQLRNSRIDERREMPGIPILECCQPPVVAGHNPTA